MSSSRSASAVFTLSRCAVLSAMAAVLYAFEIPVVAFYRLDLSTLPAILAGLAMGPGPGAAVVAVKNLLHLPFTQSAFVGEAADMLVSGAFVVTAGLVYRKRKDRTGARRALLLGTGAMTLAGMVTNLFLLIPAYAALMNLSVAQIVAMGTAACAAVDSVLTLVLLVTGPFNLLKGAVLSAAAWLVYKRMSPLLHPAAGR